VFVAGLRGPATFDDVTVPAQDGAALSCLDTALEAWSASAGKNRAIRVLDETMRLLPLALGTQAAPPVPG